jgi:hypothetical protein
MQDRAEWERELKAARSWAMRTDQPVRWPYRLADLPDAELTAEVLRRGDKIDLTEVLAVVPDARLYREVSRRGPLRLNLSEIAGGELYGELGRRRQAKRQVHRGGPGRPSKPRCACGQLTLDAAGRKGHSCENQADLRA